MPLFRPSLTRHAVSSASSTRRAARDYLKSRTPSNLYPVVPTCPSPTCACADVPPGLDIDRSKDLNGTMAAYSEHLIIPTGRADWKSKIEDEKNTAPWGELVANVKQALGQKGDFHDPYRNVVNHSAQALLFPSFKLIQGIKTTREDIPSFIRAFLLPEMLHHSYDSLSVEERKAKTRRPSLTEEWLSKVHPISTPTILVCSHNSRDSRCGILGPLLHAEFSKYLEGRSPPMAVNGRISTDASPDKPRYGRFDAGPTPSEGLGEVQMQAPAINVGMISHIGGHKWAGNVIVYIPPRYRGLPRSVTLAESELNPLGGKGIWYGRVEPKHVEGIVEETLGKGRIIRDIFRGGIHQDGTMMRL